MAEGNRADTALDGLRRVEAKAVCALTPHPPHSKTLARGPALSLVQGRKARQNVGEFSPGLRPPSPRIAGRGQGEGLVVGGSWPVSTASASRELSNTHGNSVFWEARRKTESMLKQTNADLRQDVAARANPSSWRPPPKIVGGNDSEIPLLYMKAVYGYEFKSDGGPRAGGFPGSRKRRCYKKADWLSRCAARTYAKRHARRRATRELPGPKRSETLHWRVERELKPRTGP